MRDRDAETKTQAGSRTMSRLTIDVAVEKAVVGFDILPAGKRKPREIVEIEAPDRMWGSWDDPYKLTLDDGSVLELQPGETFRMDLGKRKTSEELQAEREDSQYLVNVLTGERICRIAPGSDGDAEFEAMYS